MIVEKHLHIDLIKKVKQGSYEDFTRLYFMYADLLYGFVLNLTKSPDDAEDILQETFLRIWQTKENLSLETSFKSYLYTIAHNLIIDSFRKKIDSVAFEVYIQSDAYQNYTENNTEKAIVPKKAAKNCKTASVIIIGFLLSSENILHASG